jgi:hypothetical protein
MTMEVLLPVGARFADQAVGCRRSRPAPLLLQIKLWVAGESRAAGVPVAVDRSERVE